MIDTKIAISDMTTEQLTKILHEYRGFAKLYEEAQEEIKNRVKSGEDVNNSMICANTYIIKGRDNTTKQIEYLSQKLMEADNVRYMEYMDMLAKEEFKNMGSIAVKIKFKEVK